MFLELIESAVGIVGDVAKVAAAPVEVALDVTQAVTKPIAEVAVDIAKGVKDELGD